MKKSLFPLLAITLIVAACTNWKKAPVVEAKRIVDENKSTTKLPYQSFEKDPYQVRIYTLENGLKVYVSPNKEEPRIQTLVVVKAGSVNDPSDATGLAHYLEHMLFKGNNQIGTVNYESEKIEIDKIKALFEQLKKEQNELVRKKIYREIDSISGVAAQFACPNEIDQMFTQIGATGTNAFTSNEYTGYINDIPSNQLKNWLAIEKERYTQPVLRLFHTELEAVYEEKNISLDNADRKMYEAFSAALFPKHNYGQQTTIGTVEHLKSPSMLAIDKFFDQYYVPNNMAIFLSGDVDPDSAFSLVKEKFSSFKPKEVKPYQFEKDSLESIKEIHQNSKEAEKIIVGFKFPGAQSDASFKLTLIDMLLNNSTAGLIDININQAQKAINAFSYPRIMKDYCMHVIGAQPLPGQSLEEVKTLLLSQIELIKKGQFENWLLEAVVNDLKKRELQAGRSNRSRVSKMSESFALGISWEEQLAYFDRLSDISKEELVQFANQYYGENYVVVYRHQTDSVKNIQVEKPQITPLKTNPNNQSKFLLEFSAQAPPQPITPLFINYDERIEKSKTKDGIPILYQANSIDQLFNLTFSIPLGTKHDAELPMATGFFELCGTANQPLKALKERWYQMGIDFSIGVGEEETSISLSGLNRQLPEALILLKEIFDQVQADEKQLELQKQKIIQLRANSLKDKRNLLWSGLKNFLIYGEQSPLLKTMTNEEIKNVNAAILIEKVKSLLTKIENIQYYGPSSIAELSEVLPDLGIQNSSEIVADFQRLPKAKSNEIYLLDFDMQQAEILMFARKQTFNPKEQALIKLFNEYFGGSMSSIVFQELREKRALAYSVYAGYTSVRKKEDPHYVIGYIGTQADKYEEALKAMFEIMQSLPYDSLKFHQAKQAILQQYASERIGEQSILSAYYADSQLGYSYDKRKDIYEALDSLTFEDVSTFFKENLANNYFRIAILGNTSKMDRKVLNRFGTVRELKLEELFGY